MHVCVRVVCVWRERERERESESESERERAREQESITSIVSAAMLQTFVVLGVSLHINCTVAHFNVHKQCTFHVHMMFTCKVF